MENVRDFIPKNKHDFESVNLLKSKGYSFYKPILKDLFEWIQDMNWPIADEIVPLLILSGKDSIQILKDILNSNDDIWKYWTLLNVVMKMPDETIIELLPILNRINANPTNKEKAEDVQLIASQIIKRFI
jgi:hypothetical protein